VSDEGDIDMRLDWQDAIVISLVSIALTVMLLAPVFAYKDNRIKQLEVAIKMHGMPLPGESK
jgi:hypothetical protein